MAKFKPTSSTIAAGRRVVASSITALASATGIASYVLAGEQSHEQVAKCPVFLDHKDGEHRNSLTGPSSTGRAV